MLENIFRSKKTKHKIMSDRNDLSKVIPRNLVHYNLTNVHLMSIESNKISVESLNNYFRRSINAIYNLNGEITGHLISQLDSKYEFNAQDLGIQDLFVEATNSIIEHILINLEEQNDVLTHLTGPLLINDNLKGPNEHIKKMRVLSILNKSLNEKQFYQLDYILQVDNTNIPFHIFLMLNFDELGLGV